MIAVVNVILRVQTPCADVNIALRKAMGTAGSYNGGPNRGRSCKKDGLTALCLKQDDLHMGSVPSHGHGRMRHACTQQINGSGNVGTVS